MDSSVQMARGLRRRQTEAEIKLWHALRNKRFGMTRFRRQQPIGPYVADFYCSVARLIVEVDGSQHGTDVGLAHDAARTDWLTARGYSVIRFWNAEVLANLPGVLDAIEVRFEELKVPYHDENPSSGPCFAFGSAAPPSPSRGEGKGPF
jgi:very-short-patch-repair endonuclease